MKIVDVASGSARSIEQIARLLVDGFADTGSAAWRSIEEAATEVRESLQPDRISRMALDECNNVLGWIAGMRGYAGRVWELHPVVVCRARRLQGLGRMLTADFEEQVAARGGITVHLGTDDENGRTTLGGMDLYPGVLEKLRAIENRGGHPFGFYLKVGYHIVGVIPDANGFGKPDILMAKRVGLQPQSRQAQSP